MLSSQNNNYYFLILYGEYLFRKVDYDLALNYFHKSLCKKSVLHLYLFITSRNIYLHNKNIRLATYFLEKSIMTNPTLASHTSTNGSNVSPLS